MKFCTKCGKSLDPKARFCTSCGQPTPAAAESLAPASPLPPVEPPVVELKRPGQRRYEAPPPPSDPAPYSPAPYDAEPERAPGRGLWDRFGTAVLVAAIAVVAGLVGVGAFLFARGSGGGTPSPVVGTTATTPSVTAAAPGPTVGPGSAGAPGSDTPASAAGAGQPSAAPSGQPSAAPSGQPSGQPSATAASAPASLQSSPAGGADQQAVTAIAALLDASASTRAVVGPTVIGVLNCSISPVAGAKALVTSAASRGTLVGRLAKVAIDPTSAVAAVRHDLVTAWTASRNADTAFAKWAAAMGATCRPNHTKDPNYQAGTHYSTQADAAKKAFAAAWNPLAATFGLPPRDPDSL